MLLCSRVTALVPAAMLGISASVRKAGEDALYMEVKVEENLYLLCH